MSDGFIFQTWDSLSSVTSVPGSMSSTVFGLFTLSMHGLVDAMQIHLVPHGDSATLLQVILLTGKPAARS